MKIGDLKLTKDEKRVLQKWVDGYGRLWKGEIQRFWRGEKRALDTLYLDDPDTLMGLKDKIALHLNALRIKPWRCED